MGNRDKRDDKIKKPKKTAKVLSGRVQVAEVLPPVEVIRKRKRKEAASYEE